MKKNYTILVAYADCTGLTNVAVDIGLAAAKKGWSAWMGFKNTKYADQGYKAGIGRQPNQEQVKQATPSPLSQAPKTPTNVVVINQTKNIIANRPYITAAAARG